MAFPNWFAQYAQEWFTRHLSPLVGKPGLRFLQIGAFTGDATVWLLDNILTGDKSVLVDVDTWQGSDEPEHETFDWTEVKRVYEERTFGRSVHLRTVTGTSEQFFSVAPRGGYDFIYIDGDHTAYTVLNDGVSAYRLLKPGGLLAFDDYQWKSGKGDPHYPALAIDAITAIYAGRLDLIESGLQAWFRKSA